jgi:acetone carboxylase gamma subunit
MMKYMYFENKRGSIGDEFYGVIQGGAAGGMSGSLGWLPCQQKRVYKILRRKVVRKIIKECVCERCDEIYVPWFTPNELWNKYSAGYSFLCQRCFCFLSEQSGCNTTAWFVVVEEFVDKIKSFTKEILARPAPAADSGVQKQECGGACHDPATAAIQNGKVCE